MGDFFQSPQGLRDISISCGDVAETNFIRDCWDVSERLQRPAGDQNDWWDVAETSLRLYLTLFDPLLKPRDWMCGDIPPDPSPVHDPANTPSYFETCCCHYFFQSPRGLCRDGSLVRAQAIFMLETSPRLQWLISWRCCGDVSVGEIRPLGGVSWWHSENVCKFHPSLF